MMPANGTLIRNCSPLKTDHLTCAHPSASQITFFGVFWELQRSASVRNRKAGGA